MPTPPRIPINLPIFATFAFALVALGTNALGQNAGLEEQRKRSLITTTYNEANADFAAGKFAEAATKLEKVIGMITDPNEQQMLAPIYFTLGAAYFNTPNYPKAVETLKAFLQKYPGSDRVMEVRLSLAQSLLFNKSYKEAGDLYEQLERIPALRDKAIAAQIQLYKEQDKRR
jgi:outer membrane protein assembly factor BamD (BamD/ComL family)